MKFTWIIPNTCIVFNQGLFNILSIFFLCWYLLPALTWCSKQLPETILEVLQFLHHHQNLLLICRFLQFGFCCSSIGCQSVDITFSAFSCGCLHLEHELCTVKNLLSVFTPSLLTCWSWPAKYHLTVRPKFRVFVAATFKEVHCSDQMQILKRFRISKSSHLS